MPSETTNLELRIRGYSQETMSRVEAPETVPTDEPKNRHFLLTLGLFDLFEFHVFVLLVGVNSKIKQ